MSDLTRKYRNTMPEFDEQLLIGDATADLAMRGDFESLACDDGLQTKSAAGLSSNKHTRKLSRRRVQSGNKHDLSSAGSTAAVADKATADPELLVRQRGAARVRAAISHSRFPRTWNDALEHAGGALVRALADGHDRLRVDVHYPHVLHGAPKVDVSTREDDSHIRNSIYLAHITASLISAAISAKQLGLYSIKKNFNPRSVVILFNSQREADAAGHIVKACERQSGIQVRVGILGQIDIAEFLMNLVFVIAPNNRRGNPTQIEAVEQVHYSNFNIQNWVVMLDPDLVALTNFPSLSGEPRQPVLMTDYLTTYHMDPAAYPSKVATGAMLRCFPRKWELYLQKADDANGYRLVSEQPARPSLQKIHCEFSWRIESGRL